MFVHRYGRLDIAIKWPAPGQRLPSQAHRRFSSGGRRYLISPSMVSASQLCSVEKLVIGKGCAGPGTNFWTNPN